MIFHSYVKLPEGMLNDFWVSISGFQSLGLRLVRRFLPALKTGTEPWIANPATLEPAVGFKAGLSRVNTETLVLVGHIRNPVSG